MVDKKNTTIPEEDIELEDEGLDELEEVVIINGKEVNLNGD